MPGLLGRIEDLLERAVEGGSRAIFRQKLQPIELAKAAARAMERGQQIGPDGIDVPNAFTISLHPADLAEIEPYRSSLEARIRRYLDQFALQRGLIPVAAISVHLDADPSLRRRAVRATARMADAGTPPHGVESPLTRPVAPVAPTAHLPQIRRESVVAAPSGTLLLALEDGRMVTLGSGSLRIGRAPDNDLVISDSRVSRYHAQVVQDRAGPHIRDLGSTNGTLLAGRPVTDDLFGPGDQLSIGGFGIRVLAGPAR